MYRVRPGDSLQGSRSKDHVIITLVLFVVIKNALRRLFMVLPLPVEELKDRYMLILEHSIFVYFAYHVLVVAPGAAESWLSNPIHCWSEPTFPSELFHLFYLAKTATHVEDLLFAAWIYFQTPSLSSLPSSSATTITFERDNPNHNESSPVSSSSLSSSTSPNRKMDTKMHLHHIATALLCLTSYFSGYVKIGSIIMFLHDVSDLPLDFLRLFTTLHMNPFVIVAFITTLLTWAYWRLFYFPFYVLRSVAFESKSRFDQGECRPGFCTWSDVPERIPFLLLLSSLFVLHLIWFGELIKKGYRKLVLTKVSP
jgi:hypothetical protein